MRFGAAPVLLIIIFVKSHALPFLCLLYSLGHNILMDKPCMLDNIASLFTVFFLENSHTVV